MRKRLNIFVSILIILSNPASAQDRKMFSYSDEEISDWIGTYMSYSEKFDQFGGVVLVARNGRPIFQKAYGMAN